MVDENNALAIIPSECFRWRARVQFIESFRTQAAAMNFAFEHGYNLIVERNEGSSQLYDVLQDPDRACTADLKLDILSNEEVLVEPEPNSWTLLLFWTLWNLAKRFGAAMATVYMHQVAPRLSQASKRQAWAMQRAFRLVWYRHAHWSIHHLNRRVGTAVSLYQSEIKRYCRHAASRYWWSGGAVDFRRWLHRHSQGDGRDLAKRLAAVISSIYNREIAPRTQQAAVKIKEAHYKELFLRAARVSYLTGRSLSRSITATSSKMYRQEVTPRLRHAANWVRWSEYKGILRLSWGIMLLTAIRLIDKFVTAVSGVYAREVDPRLRRAAARYEQEEIEEAFRRTIGVASSPQHSNSSQLG